MAFFSRQYTVKICIILAIVIDKIPNAESASGLIIFGDSLVDVGVNTYLQTRAKANFFPYGRDFAGGATGRFSNGRVLSDFIASWMGIPSPLPYNHPAAKGETILSGINFASSESGYLNNTGKRSHIASLTKQLQWFKLYQQKLVQIVGFANTSDIISNALFLLCTGSNDYTQNYYHNKTLRRQYTPDQFREHLISFYENAIQGLYDSGARRIAVCSYPPIGCFPAQITIHGKGSLECINTLNQDVQEMNSRLIKSTEELNKSLTDLNLIYLDIYGIMLDASQNPQKFGFSVGSTGCCGSGRFEASILCNFLTPTCTTASKYVYWDAYHATDSMNSILAQSIFPTLVA